MIGERVAAEVAKLSAKPATEISTETRLIGSEGVLDSMRLVELCLALEDLAAERGFEFDWASESAMSRSRGMFRTVGSLAAEFAMQESSAQ